MPVDISSPDTYTAEIVFANTPPSTVGHTMNSATIKHEVRAAFAALERPHHDALVPHACSLCHGLAAALGSHTASALPPALLQKHVWDLPLLSDEAKQYYLPAWLCSSIDEPCSDATDALLMEFRSDHRWNPATPYTVAQWAAIGEWLDLMLLHCDPYSRDDVEGVYIKLKPRLQALRAMH